MLNLAGSSYDVTHVLFAVLQECEHRRRTLLPNEAEMRIHQIAREKLAEIEKSYRELGGTDGYWRDIEREVMGTSVPQYVLWAGEQNRLEREGYGIWRNADPLARVAFSLAGLTLGGIIVALPFIPIFEDTFAFALALAGFLYPEIVRGYYEHRHSRRLNRLILRAEKYQNDRRLHYESEANLEEVLGSLGKPVLAKRAMVGVRPIAPLVEPSLSAEVVPIAPAPLATAPPVPAAPDAPAPINPGAQRTSG